MGSENHGAEQPPPLEQLIALGEDVQELGVTTLSACIEAAGLYAATPLLVLCSAKQIRLLVDRAVWSDDKLDNEKLQHWVFALARITDRARASEHLAALDVELLAFLLKNACFVFLADRNEVPPNPEGTFYLAPDGRFTLDLLTEPGSETEQMKNVLDLLYAHDVTAARKLLVDVAWEPLERLEARARRLRDARGN